jgi:RsmE family RNA methyltransferase
VNLILLERDEVSGAGEVLLSGARATHVLQVLKAVPSRTIRVGIVDGPLGSGTVLATDAARVSLRCVFESHPPDCQPVDVLLALPRPKVMKRLWAQLSAIGVGRIVLTNAERVERDYFGTHVLDPVLYRPLLIEGLQQARDTRIPMVSIHRQFRPLVEDGLDMLAGDSVRLLADPQARSTVADATPAAAGRVMLAVGPEGGWNDFERDLLQKHGFTPVSMGARTLRTDTACIALLTLAHAALSRA